MTDAELARMTDAELDRILETLRSQGKLDSKWWEM